MSRKREINCGGAGQTSVAPTSRRRFNIGNVTWLILAVAGNEAQVVDPEL